MSEKDEGLDRLCNQMLQNFQYLTKLKLSNSSSNLARNVANGLQKRIKDQNPEFLKFVIGSNHNAVLTVHVGHSRLEDSGWFESERNAYHTWVEQKYPNGVPRVKKITIQPTAKEIKAAKKANKPRPKAKVIEKKLYELVFGEYTSYKNVRSMSIPYSVTLEDLRKKVKVTVIEGVANSQSQSQYHEYSGNQKAKSAHSGNGPEGRHNAPKLMTTNQLLQKTKNQIPSQITTKLLKRIE